MALNGAAGEHEKGRQTELQQGWGRVGKTLKTHVVLAGEYVSFSGPMSGKSSGYSRFERYLPAEVKQGEYPGG